MALNNIYGDASLMKEYLSYKLMTEMGVDTPYYALVNLYINDEFYGVYMMVGIYRFSFNTKNYR
jgi:CotH protein.